jgi:hypothetical protein
MKNFFFLSLLCTISIFGYSAWNVDSANYLADNGIIKDNHGDVAQYRLDDRISRQEVVGIAMKLGGYELPENYACIGYFSDTYFDKNHSDAWVCRSVEIASNNGIVSRANKTFRPKDFITRAEALAILMKSKNLKYVPNVIIWINNQPTTLLYPTAPQWQIDMIEAAHSQGIINVYTGISMPEDVFKPNNLATRSEVFDFATKIVQNSSNNSPETSQATNTTPSNYTYTSQEGKFRITYPDFIFLDNKHDSNTTLVTNNNPSDIISATFLSEDSSLVFIVNRAPCVADECTNTSETMQWVKQIFIQAGATIEKDFGKNLLLLGFEANEKRWIKKDSKQLSKIIFHSDFSYTITAIADADKWSIYEPLFLEMIDSFQTF